MRLSLALLTVIIFSPVLYGATVYKDLTEQEHVSADDMRSLISGTYTRGQREYSEVEINYIQKDLCFTTHILGECTLEGPEISFSIPVYRDTLFIYGRYADIETRDGIRDDGKPFYQTKEAEVGVGFDVNLSDSVNLVAKVGFNTASDTEWWAGRDGKSIKQGNYNEGVKFEAKIKKELNKHVSLCAGYIQDHAQNSSNSLHHGLKSKKPKMKFGHAEVCGVVRVTDNLYIKTSIKKMVKKPTRNRSNQFDVYHAQELPDEPDYSIGFKYIFR